MKSSGQQAWFIVILIAAAVGGLLLSTFMHRPKNRIVLPAGAVQIKTFHYPISFIAQLKGDSHAGQKIFKGYCGHCHEKDPMIPLGAPKIGDHRLWTVIQKQGIKKLVSLTVNGYGRMPARGGCFECSDAQLKQAIQYIIEKKLITS